MYGLAGFLIALSFAGSVLFPPQTGTENVRLMPVLLALLFLINGLQAWMKWRQLGGIDYGEQVLSFLDKAEKRYRFFKKKEWLPAISLLLLAAICAGIYIVDLADQSFGMEFRGIAVGLYCLFFLSVGIFGFRMSKKNWQRDKAPLWREIQRMKKELEEPRE